MNNEILSIFCDGGARGNPGPATCAFVVKTQKGQVVKKQGKFLGVNTNNQAEYSAVLEAFKWLTENNQLLNTTREINFYLDSNLVVSQLNGIYKVKNAELRNLLFDIRSLESQVNSKIIYHQIPREKNQDADLLVNQTFDQLR